MPVTPKRPVTAATESRTSALESLQSLGDATQLAEVLLLLETNRPSDPLSFLAAHFSAAAYGPRPVEDAKRLVSLTSTKSPTFSEIVAQAFFILSNDEDHMPKDLLRQFLGELMMDVPATARGYLLQVLTAADTLHISFRAFHSAVASCLLLRELAADQLQGVTLSSACHGAPQGGADRELLEGLQGNLAAYIQATAGPSCRLEGTEEHCVDASLLDGWQQYAAAHAAPDAGSLAAVVVPRLQALLASGAATEQAGGAVLRDGL